MGSRCVHVYHYYHQLGHHQNQLSSAQAPSENHRATLSAFHRDIALSTFQQKNPVTSVFSSDRTKDSTNVMSSRT